MTEFPRSMDFNPDVICTIDMMNAVCLFQMQSIFHRLKEPIFNPVFVLFSLSLYSAMGGLGRVDHVESAQLHLHCTKAIFHSHYFIDMSTWISLE